MPINNKFGDTTVDYPLRQAAPFHHRVVAAIFDSPQPHLIHAKLKVTEFQKYLL